MKLIPLNEAAAMLGVPVEKLLEMRSNNEVFGYRDGSTWKFKETELERVAGSMGISMSTPGAESVDGVDLDLASETGSDSNILSSIDSDLDEMVSIEDSDLISPAKPPSNDADPAPESPESPESPTSLDSEDDFLLQLDDEPLELDANAMGESGASPEDSGLAVDVPANASDDDSFTFSLEEDGSSVELDLDETATTGSDAAANSGADTGVSLEEESSDGSFVLSLDDADDDGSDVGLVLEDDGDDGVLASESGELSLAVEADESSATLIGDPGTVTDEVPIADGSGFDFDLSDVDLSPDSDVSGPALTGTEKSGAVDSDILDLEEGSDLVLEAASDLNLAMSDSAIELDLDGNASSSSLKLNESGIDLTSPSDSGLTLEGDVPELSVDPDGAALELGEADIIDLGDEAVDLDEATVMADDDFLLEPVEADIEDLDSGSQIIALDTEEIAPDADALLADDAFIETTTEVGIDELDGGLGDGVAEVAPLGAAAAAATAPEVPFTVWNIVLLATCALILAMTGMMMTDLVMNMWSWNEPYALNSSLMDSVLGIFGM